MSGKPTIHLNGFNNKDCPCKGCIDRYFNCHSQCASYIDWRQQHDVKLAERRE